jgi:hypothetical protein
MPDRFDSLFLHQRVRGKEAMHLTLIRGAIPTFSSNLNGFALSNYKVVVLHGRTAHAEWRKVPHPQPGRKVSLHSVRLLDGKRRYRTSIPFSLIDDVTAGIHRELSEVLRRHSRIKQAMASIRKRGIPCGSRL